MIRRGWLLWVFSKFFSCFFFDYVQSVTDAIYHLV